MRRRNDAAIKHLRLVSLPPEGTALYEYEESPTEMLEIVVEPQRACVVSDMPTIIANIRALKAKSLAAAKARKPRGRVLNEQTTRNLSVRASFSRKLGGAVCTRGKFIE